ncbi:hypothetical protein CCHL11_07663 [Colletotrichum chlorophyti]|uniref:Uncharacterized protein n=1 Tax=Colletotrichum chlorophyti TaxID=708187 RepID=A0A1Q8RD09_9PEZI|nr:hypothetical protein CCHL11_07663 [Colletotrichum chlorophyti]
MKHSILALAALLSQAMAMPQEVPQNPDIPAISTSLTTITVTGQQVPAPPTDPIANIPLPNPTAPVPAPVPADPSVPPQAPSGGPNCVCGATYCGKVLVGFQGYTSEQLGQGYCTTPGTNCEASPPTTESLEDTLFVCICPPGQDQGSTIELICPCQGRCKNDQPDFIGRCETPCNLGCGPVAPTLLPEPIPLPEPLPAPAPPAPALPASRRE